MVANPARGQLDKEKFFSLSPFAPEILIFRDGFDRPVSRQPARVHYSTTTSMMHDGSWGGGGGGHALPPFYYTVQPCNTTH